MAIIKRKWQIQAKNEKNWAKMESSRIWAITNEMTKRGILTNENFIKIINLAKN